MIPALVVQEKSIRNAAVESESTVLSKLKEFEDMLPDSAQLAFMHRIDNVLFSHGGLTTDFVRWLDEALLDADIDDVIAAVNEAPQEYLWNDESPLWLRPQYNDRDIFRNDMYTQVVGHTPVKNIYKKDRVISTDVFSTYRDGRQIGESAMIVIDTKTGEYGKVNVLGTDEAG